MAKETIITQRLTDIRKKLGLTKQQTAQKLGMSQPTYLRYENGDRIPSFHVLRTIAEVLGTSVDYLTGKTDDPSPDFLLIKKETDRDLFLFVQKYQSDEDFKKRILAYLLKLNS